MREFGACVRVWGWVREYWHMCACVGVEACVGVGERVLAHACVRGG